MEPSKEPVSVRVARLNAEIIGKTIKLDTSNLLARETLLDVLQALYEECSLENLQKYDANIAQFVNKYKETVKELKQLRVNVTDFEIKNVIGRGHFGEVHLVKEKQTGDVYAMKTLRKFDSDTKRTSFEEERNIMAFSDSPWLTSLQYSFQDNTYLFFVMEYHPGGDLLGLLYRQGGTLPESAATFYVAELVLALEDLHKMGYVHRDIKPDNVLLDRCGHLKLADFGSAAKLNENGLVNASPPVGTPDYIAPEVLQCLDNKNGKTAGYGVSCDFWSLGIVAYELIVGSTPFTGQNTTTIYSKIMNAKSNLKFPPDIVLSQAYVSFIKALITDQKNRLNLDRIRKHELFAATHFDTLRDQVPPFVPKITSVEDTSNFNDVQSKRKTPSIESFKKRTQFSGRNLPFVGFTFTHDLGSFEGGFDRKIVAKDEAMEGLKSEIEGLRRKLVKNEEFDQERDALERKLEEKQRKIESMESLRDRLEKDLASNIAENVALKRTLDLERKDRAELERRALDLIKGAKLKWEIAEKTKIDALILEIDQQKEKIAQLTATNDMLNEQLQHALRAGDKHKESLEKVQDLSRKSVVGLESRLERVTSETQNTIVELQRKLSEEKRRNNVLEGQLTKMKDEEERLLRKLKRAEREYDELRSKIDEAEIVISRLGEQVTTLENDTAKIENYEKEVTKLQEIVDNSHKTIKDLENRNLSLQIEAKSLEEQKRETERLKKTIAQLQNDRRVEELETQLFEEREKCRELKKRLQDSERVVTENQELRELRTKHWRMEKDLGNCKIDKRILERELKDAQAEIKKLSAEIEERDRNLSEIKKTHQAALLELSDINESISMELIKLKDAQNSLQLQLEREKEKTDEEKVVIQELKGVIKNKEGLINTLNAEINGLKREKSALESEIRKNESEKSKLTGMIEQLQKDKCEISNELDKSKLEIQNANLNLSALREACTLLESQVVEFEKINASFEARHSALNGNTEKLVQDLCKAKEDVQEARKRANEEKSLRLLAESKIKRLNEDVACLQDECLSYKNQCAEYRQCASNLSDELTAAEEKITDLQTQAKSYERVIEDLRTESKIIKQEVSDYLTSLAKVKEANHRVNHQLGEARKERSELVQRLNELERELDEKNNYYRERDMKAEATIKQQIKLIDYLQSKIDELSNKKKTFTEVLFGSSKKENQPPPPVLNYKELETQLLKERESNRRLNEEVHRLKAASMIRSNENLLEKTNNKVQRHKSEIVSPRSKSPKPQMSQQKAELYRHNSVHRMHHNIPHRFESKLCAKSSIRCARCLDSIPLGRTMNVCKECNVTAHSHCSISLSNTCGLPKAYAKHYKESFHSKSEETATKTTENDNVNVEGWVKIPGKNNCWEKRYACLTDTAINIYTGPPNENGSTLLEEFALKPANSHGKVVSEPSPSELGVAVATSDLPFVLKVEVAPDTTCWPQKCLVLMTLSAQDKDKWFIALQKVYEDDLELPKLQKVCEVPSESSVNCVSELSENVLLIGTDRGLYAHQGDDLVYIEGFTAVHHVASLRNTNTTLMIVDAKNVLVSCDSYHLLDLADRARPKINYVEVNVNNLNGFHLLQTSECSNNVKVCVATAKQLVILRYDLETSDLTVERVLDTAEPTSCALFTDYTLIVGADKFFEIDLRTYQADEFLDPSDIKLKQAVKCFRMRSFPLAILRVSRNPHEYLVCFNEFSMFVDEYGRSSRNTEMKSTHLPLGFHFSKPYLYSVQFAGVEITKITDDTCSGDSSAVSETVRLDLGKFKWVGVNKKGLYIVQSGDIKFVDARQVVDLDLSSTVSESVETESSDRFSFTSSIVQSLDGNLSDPDSAEAEARHRKVKFTESQL